VNVNINLVVYRTDGQSKPHISHFLQKGNTKMISECKYKPCCWDPSMRVCASSSVSPWAVASGPPSTYCSQSRPGEPGTHNKRSHIVYTHVCLTQNIFVHTLYINFKILYNLKTSVSLIPPYTFVSLPNVLLIIIEIKVR